MRITLPTILSTRNVPVEAARCSLQQGRRISEAAQVRGLAI